MRGFLFGSGRRHEREIGWAENTGIVALYANTLAEPVKEGYIRKYGKSKETPAHLLA